MADISGQKNDMIISVKGLRSGTHLYEFDLDRSFFDYFGNTQIKDASIKVVIELEKGSGWMTVTDHSEGRVTVECDRCLEDLDIPVDFTVKIGVKQVKGEDIGEQQNGEFLLVDQSDGELDLRQFVYDYVCLNLPVIKVHRDGECNMDMMERLRKSATPADWHGGNTPFEGLDKLLNKKQK